MHDQDQDQRPKEVATSSVPLNTAPPVGCSGETWDTGILFPKGYSLAMYGIWRYVISTNSGPDRNSRRDPKVICPACYLNSSGQQTAMFYDHNCLVIAQ